jgi:transposase
MTGKKLKLEFSLEHKLLLEGSFKYSENWRVRQRAKTLLLLNDILSVNEVAAELDIHPRTVAITTHKWLSFKFEALPDRERCGAPKKISESQREFLLETARAQPLSGNELLAAHMGNGGARVHIRTMTRTLKTLELVWKRTRHSLKKNETS